MGLKDQSLNPRVKPTITFLKRLLKGVVIKAVNLKSLSIPAFSLSLQSVETALPESLNHLETPIPAKRELDSKLNNTPGAKYNGLNLNL